MKHKLVTFYLYANEATSLLTLLNLLIWITFVFLSPSYLLQCFSSSGWKSDMKEKPEWLLRDFSQLELWFLLWINPLDLILCMKYFKYSQACDAVGVLITRKAECGWFDPTLPQKMFSCGSRRAWARKCPTCLPPKKTKERKEESCILTTTSISFQLLEKGVFPSVTHNLRTEHAVFLTSHARNTMCVDSLLHNVRGGLSCWVHAPFKRFMFTGAHVVHKLQILVFSRLHKRMMIKNKEKQLW